MGEYLLCTGLYLAINALAYTEDGAVVKRRLEVNWFGAEVGPPPPPHIVAQAMPGDEIRVYDGSDTLLATIPPTLYPDGFHVLPGNLPYPSLVRGEGGKKEVEKGKVV